MVMPFANISEFKNKAFKRSPALITALFMNMLFSAKALAAPLSRFLSVEFEPDGFQISEMVPPTNHTFFARHPAIASSSKNGFLLTVWEGTDPPRTGINDWEIFGQLFYGLADTYLPAAFKN
jgi:hypothetical protein